MPRSLVRAILRAVPKIRAHANGNPEKQRAIWEAMTRQGLGSFTEDSAAAYVDSVLHLDKLGAQKVGVLAGLSLAFSEQQMSEGAREVIFKHVMELQPQGANMAAMPRQTPPVISDIAHLASAMMTLPHEELASFCECLNRLWGGGRRPPPFGHKLVWRRPLLLRQRSFGGRSSICLSPNSPCQKVPAILNISSSQCLILPLT